MCHHRRTEYTRLYEDGEHKDLPQWALEEKATESDEESEPFAPGAAD